MKINDKFKNLIPELTKEELEQLEENILKDGIREPLVVWNETIIDGHNRYKICMKHNIIYETVEKQFASEEEAIDWIIDNQLGRRNLTWQQASLLRGMQYEREKKKKTNALGINQHVKEDGDQNDHQPKTANILAEKYNVSEPTIRRDAKYAKSVEEISKIVPKVKQKILNGEYKITKTDMSKIASKEPKEIKEIVKQLEDGKKSSEILKDNLNLPIDEIAEETKKCKRCGVIKPISEFYNNKNVCKDCTNSMRKIYDLKGNEIKSNPEVDKLISKYGNELVESFQNEDKEIIMTSEDFFAEYESIANYFIKNIEDTLERYIEEYKTKFSENDVNKIKRLNEDVNKICKYAEERIK